MKNLFVALILCFCTSYSAFSQSFDDYFVDKTLRVDYLFTGDANHQDIYLDELCSLPRWAGRRQRLSELPLEGNGDITVADKATGTVIYRTSFSSLFQEWVSEDEAKHVKRGFENTFLLPFPKQPVTVTVRLKDVYHKPVASLTHEVNPGDILIHRRGLERITPHRYLLESGPATDCIDVAILAEGYTAAEITATGDDLLKEIWLERRKELWGEGFALTDIIRNQQPVERKAWQHFVECTYNEHEDGSVTDKTPIVTETGDVIFADDKDEAYQSKYCVILQGHSTVKLPDGTDFVPNSKYYLFRITEQEELQNLNLYNDHPKLDIYR